MMPTPGPYNTFQVSGGTAVHINGICIAVFYDAEGCPNGVSEAQAAANARAWVEGMAALEKMERLLAVEREWSESKTTMGDAFHRFIRILDEP